MCYKDYIVDVWELRKARQYGQNLGVPQSQSQTPYGELGDVGMLRCLHGKVDTTNFYVCIQVLLALPNFLSVLSMALVLWLPFKYCYIAT